MFATSVYRMLHPPYFLGGMAMFWGYLKSAVKRLPRYRDKELRKFINTYQWRCLLLGKHKATELLNDKQKPVWKESGQSGNIGVAQKS